jgi:hypothetical protein
VLRLGICGDEVSLSLMHSNEQFQQTMGQNEG